MNENTNRTFARINSKSSGPVFGIKSSVVKAFQPCVLHCESFPEWGGDLKGFTLEKNTAWELLELLVLAYECRKFGQGSLRSHREGKLNARRDIEALEDQEPSTEGAEKTHTSIVAERDPSLRIAAIHIHGLTYKACGFNFEEYYGELGESYIEVHHKDPFGESPGVRKTNPTTDLDVLCANCHRMVHRKRGKVLPVEELRRILEETSALS